MSNQNYAELVDVTMHNLPQVADCDIGYHVAAGRKCSPVAVHLWYWRLGSPERKVHRWIWRCSLLRRARKQPPREFVDFLLRKLYSSAARLGMSRTEMRLA